MKIDNGYFYNIEPVVDLEHFIELLLVTLASHNSLLYSRKTKTTMIAKLPYNYKKNIEEAMYDDSNFIMNFAELIDTYSYYEKQSEWELELAGTLKKYLDKNNKIAKYNFEFDYFEIDYGIDELENILKKYDDDTRYSMVCLVRYIENEGFERYHSLTWKEASRSTKRKYIRTSATTFSNCWSKISEKEDKNN